MDASPSPIAHFDHVTIAAASLEQAIAQYSALLGEAPFWVGAHPELGTEGALFRLDNGVIEITAPRANDELSDGLRAWLAETGGGLQALAFGTGDAAACTRLLRERGLRATPPQPGEAIDAQGQVRAYQTVELSPRATGGLPVLIVERAVALHAQRTPGPADRPHAIDHVALFVGDVEAARKLYVEQLGLRLALERDFNGTRMLFVRVGGVTIELIEDRARGDRQAFYGLAYRVRDLEAAHQRIGATGAQVSDIRTGNKPGTRVFTVRDRTSAVPTLVLHDPARP